MLHLTNKFLVAVRLFSDRSQMTSQCGDTKNVAHEPSGKCVTDVICYSTDLWSTTEQTHGNMEPTVFFVPWGSEKLTETSFIQLSFNRSWTAAIKTYVECSLLYKILWTHANDTVSQLKCSLICRLSIGLEKLKFDEIMPIILKK